MARVEEEFAEDEFIRVPWLGMNGVSRQAGFRTSFTHLLQALGEPDIYDELGSKVAFTWAFKNRRTGASVAIYDYKATSLYNPRYPTLENFMKKSSYEWSVGAVDAEEAELFLIALKSGVGGVPIP